MDKRPQNSRAYNTIWGLPYNLLDKSVRDTYYEFSSVFGLYPSLAAIRLLYRKSSLLQAIALQIGANVIGHEGPQPTFNNVTSKRDRESLTAWWNAWQADVLVTCDGTSWAEFLTALETDKFLTGRGFGIFRRHADYPMGLGLMTVSRECQAGGGYARQSYSMLHGYEVVNGTAFHESGKIAGYIFQQRLKPQEVSKQGTVLGWGYKVSGDPIFVPAMDVLDNRSFSVTDDWDGYPHMVLPVLHQLSRIFRLDQATLDGMESAAKKMGFLKKPEGTEAIDWEKEQDWYPPLDELKANHIEDLPPGYEFQGFDPSVPNTDHHRQRREYIMNACTGVGVDYASASGDLSGVNFSSMRHGVLTSRDNYRIRQHRLGSRVCRKALCTVLDHATMFGGLNLRSMASLDEAKMTDFQYKSWEWVDPLKDAAASQILLKMGVTSPQKIASGLGVEYMSVVQDIAEAMAQLQKAGLTPQDIAALAGEATAAPMMETEPEQGEGMMGGGQGEAEATA